jgi:hypothetical protein
MLVVHACGLLGQQAPYEPMSAHAKLDNLRRTEVPGKTLYPRQWEWQNDVKIAMSVNLALEAFRFKSQYTQEGRRGRVDHFSLSDGEYGAKAGIWRASRLRPAQGLLAEFRPEARGTRHVAAGWPVRTWSAARPRQVVSDRDRRFRY